MQENSIKYSIAIPAYKAKFLKECIDSVMAQTYSCFELIILNDASPESIDEIVSKYNDPRIRYYKNDKNVGAERIVDNWNKCLEYATGDYLICMGDDDKLLPCCLEEYAKLIEKFPGLDVYHGWTEIIDEESVPYSIQQQRPEQESVYAAIWGRMHGRLQYIGDSLFAVESLRKAGGFYYLPFAWGSDDITFFRAAAASGVANTQVPVFQYRENRYSISSSGFVDGKMDALMDYFQWIDTFLEHHPGNGVDALYCKNLQETALGYKLEIKKLEQITADLRARGIGRIFHWMKLKGKYNISRASLVRAAFASLK